MSFGLTPKALALLQKVFIAHPEIERAQIFGSRAMGNYRPNSDIDLVFWGSIDDAQLASISGDLNELSLPYLFDVKAYSGINHPELREHIDKYGKNIYIKKSSH